MWGGGAKWLVIFLFDKESNFKIIKKNCGGGDGKGGEGCFFCFFFY